MPTSQADGTRIYEGTDKEFTDTKSQAGTTYYYALYTFDQNLNYSPAVVGASYLGKNTEAEIVQQRAEIPVAPQTTKGSGITITRWLLKGSKGQDVKTLQTYLQQASYFPATQTPTTYFGPLTEKAVQQFQCSKLTVCKGSPQSTGYGATGPKTRKALKGE